MRLAHSKFRLSICLYSFRAALLPGDYEQQKNVLEILENRVKCLSNQYDALSHKIEIVNQRIAYPSNRLSSAETNAYNELQQLSMKSKVIVAKFDQLLKECTSLVPSTSSNKSSSTSVQPVDNGDLLLMKQMMISWDERINKLVKTINALQEKFS
ncbi:unnamed protein product [Soboliphyme baturini]|uniref:Mediator of RNA polymerase II transcription subunit 22 n=1 Tax=Soboliphyme baturini TaxID=241478 RepID=A0A183J725_9BILA|nr:unnamed protein product [Soboliphyme baturini]